MKIITACLLAAIAGPAFAQSSVDVQAGNLHGSAQAGVSQGHDQVARGSRADDCNSRGVRVQSANGSASASVSTSGGSSVVAGGGSPGSRTEYFGCNTPNQDNRSTR